MFVLHGYVQNEHDSLLPSDWATCSELEEMRKSTRKREGCQRREDGTWREGDFSGGEGGTLPTAQAGRYKEVDNQKKEN